MITRLRGTAWHEPCPVLHPFWWVCLPIIASHSIWWSGKGIPVIASHTNREVDMQLVSCCIDRNGCSPVVPTVDTWTVKATKVCQLSAIRPAEGSVSQGKPTFAAPMVSCTVFLETCAVERVLDVLCVLRRTLIPRPCAEESASRPYPEPENLEYTPHPISRWMSWISTLFRS